MNNWNFSWASRVVGAAVIGACVLFAGCATPARPDQMAVAAGKIPPLPSNSALKENVAVRSVTGGRDTNPMWISNVGSSEFEQALEQSLRAAGFLAPTRQSGNYELTADLLKVDQPMFGFDMTVTTQVRYTVVERKSRKEVFSAVIDAPYTAKASDAFIGSERLKLANEGAIRENISRLLDALARQRIDTVVLK